MLKTTGSPDKLTPSRNNGNRSASSMTKNSKPTSRKNDSNGEVDRVDIGGNGVEHAKKLGKTSKSQKLSKSGKSKSEKMSKSWNLAKSGKKLLKSRNLTNSDATEDGPKFLTSNARTAFNCLRLTFTKALILWHFYPECHIWIETNVLGYAIGEVLSQLTSGTNPNWVVTKTDLS